jgi:hypothetical protein
MAAPYAFVTLISSDSYLPGALALVAALRDVHPEPPVFPEVGFKTVCLVTPETVDVSSIKLLRRAFDLVIGVEIIEDERKKALELLGRRNCHVFRYRVGSICYIHGVPCSLTRSGPIPIRNGTQGGFLYM